ncbi:hypothetical protein MXB_5018, partial [Myxobolus squamalis]
MLELISKHINLLKSPLIYHSSELCDSIATLVSILNKSKCLCSLDSTLNPPVPIDFEFDSNACILYGKSYKSFIKRTDLKPEMVLGEETLTNETDVKVVSNTAADFIDEKVKIENMDELNLAQDEIRMLKYDVSKLNKKNLFDLSKVVSKSSNLPAFSITKINTTFPQFLNTLKVGDEILEINDRPCSCMSVKEAKHMIKHSTEALK